jgi:hypothetical protein
VLCCCIAFVYSQILHVSGLMESATREQLHLFFCGIISHLRSVMSALLYLSPLFADPAREWADGERHLRAAAFISSWLDVTALFFLPPAPFCPQILHVSGLMESVTREQLRELFSQAGEVTKVDIPDRGRSMVSRLGLCMSVKEKN